MYVQFRTQIDWTLVQYLHCRSQRLDRFSSKKQCDSADKERTVSPQPGPSAFGSRPLSVAADL